MLTNTTQKNRDIIIDLLCWRHSKYNLIALRDFLGPERFFVFLEQFAGVYVRMPNNRRIWEVVDDIKLYALHTAKKQAYRARRLSEWESLEVKFENECKRRKITSRSGERIARQVAGELQQASEWLSNLSTIEEEQKKTLSPQEMDDVGGEKRNG